MGEHFGYCARVNSGVSWITVDETLGLFELVLVDFQGLNLGIEG